MGLNSTLQGDGWHVDPITEPPVRAKTDPVTGGIELNVAGTSLPTVFLLPSGDTTGVQDAARLNAAFAALAAAGQGQVVLKAGDYYVNTSIRMASNTSLRGAGYATRVRSVAAMVNDNTSNTETNVVYLYQVSNVVIEGLRIDGARTTATTGDDGQSGLDSGRNCVRGYDAHDVTIQNCHIHDAVFHGIFADQLCTDWLVSGNTIFDNGFRACHIHAAGAQNRAAERHIVTGNNVRNNGKSASALQGGSLAGLYCCFDNTSGIVVSGNTITGEDGTGIEVRGSNDAATVVAGDTTSASAVISNITTTSLRDGMYVSGNGIKVDSRILSIDSPTQVTLDKTATATASGVSLTFEPLNGEQIAITGNTVRGCSGASVAVSDWARDVVVTGNVIAGGNHRAVSLSCATGRRAKNITVAANVISGHVNTTNGYGVYIDDAERVTVDGNVISGCGKESISAADCKQVVVNGNMISSQDSYGVRVFGDGVTITNNHVQTRATVTIDITASATNCVCAFNYVDRTATGAGVVNASSTSQIFGNKLTASTTVTPGAATGPTCNIATASGANTATMTNAPVAGNPAEWISVIGPSGTARSIPAW